jgi:hypothetical protein
MAIPCLDARQPASWELEIYRICLDELRLTAALDSASRPGTSQSKGQETPLMMSGRYIDCRGDRDTRNARLIQPGHKNVCGVDRSFTSGVPFAPRMFVLGKNEIGYSITGFV